MFSVTGLVFYAASGVFIPLLWIGLIFFVMGSDVTTTSYGTELFPTRYRSTATGFRSIVSTIVGLSSVSVLFVIFDSIWVSISVLCAISLIAPVMVWVFLPETAGKPLEEISPD